jgi:hypothetical protein
MGYPTTVQLIDRKKTEQWYVNFPAAVARALDFAKGEVVEWTIETRSRLILKSPRKREEPNDREDSQLL